MVFRRQFPKWDQNIWFIPLGDFRPYHLGDPPPGVNLQKWTLDLRKHIQGDALGKKGNVWRKERTRQLQREWESCGKKDRETQDVATHGERVRNAYEKDKWKGNFPQAIAEHRGLPYYSICHCFIVGTFHFFLMFQFSITVKSTRHSITQITRLFLTKRLWSSCVLTQYFPKLGRGKS